MFEIIVEKEGLEFLGWREVPVVSGGTWHKALENDAMHMQAFIRKPDDVEKGLAFDRRLYMARRVFEQSNDNTYVVPCPAVPSFTKVCSWLDSFVHSSMIFRMPIMNRRSQWYIPVSVPTQTQAGSGHIQTVLSYTTVRSTPSGEMPIRCWPEKKLWSPPS